MSTLFDRLGGKEAVDTAVEQFYEKILSDERIKDIWADIKMGSLKCMMKKFLRQATSGESYDWMKMYVAHKHVNKGGFPTEEQYEIVVELFIRTLQELGIDTTTFLEVADVIDTAKPYILGEKKPECTRKK